VMDVESDSATDIPASADDQDGAEDQE
jgi:hypothetical protein